MKSILLVFLIVSCLATSVYSAGLLFPIACPLNACGENPSPIGSFNLDCDLTCRVALLGSGNCTSYGDPVNRVHCVCENAPGGVVNQFLIGIIQSPQANILCAPVCKVCGYRNGFASSPYGGDIACTCVV